MNEQENSFINLETFCTEGYRRFLLEQFKEAFGNTSSGDQMPACLRDDSEYQPEYDPDEESDEDDFNHPIDPDEEGGNDGNGKGFRNSAGLRGGRPYMRKKGGNSSSILSLPDNSGQGVASSSNDYTITLRELWNVRPLKELMHQHENIFNEVENQFMDFVKETEQEFEEDENPLQHEEDLLERLKENIDEDTFKELIDSLEYQELMDSYLSESDHDFFKKAEDNKAVREALIGKLEEEIRKTLQKIRNEEIRRKSKQWADELKAKAEKILSAQKLAGGTGLTSALLWGMGSGEWSLLDAQFFNVYDEILSHSKAIHNIVNMLGRMASEEKKVIEERFSQKRLTPIIRIDHAQKSEMVGVSLSDDLSNMLPSEIAFLSSPSSEKLFYKKFVEKKLQTFDYINREKLMIETTEEAVRQKIIADDGKGPIILCVDTSGSMAGEPEVIAKALALAMLQLALKENRKCYLISFSVHIKTIELTAMQDWAQLIDFIRGAFHAGTDLDPAFQEAVRMLDTNNFHRADVLTISDFIMPPLDSTTMEKVHQAKENKTRFHALIVSGELTKDMIDKSFADTSLGRTFDNLWYYDRREEASLGKGDINDLTLGKCLRGIKE